MPMAGFLQDHGLFMDGEGLHFDLAQFGAIRDLAEKVIAEREAGKLDGVWKQFDLSTDEAKAKSKAKSGSLIERFTDLKSLLPRKPAGAKAK